MRVGAQGDFLDYYMNGVLWTNGGHYVASVRFGTEELVPVRVDNEEWERASEWFMYDDMYDGRRNGRSRGDIKGDSGEWVNARVMTWEGVVEEMSRRGYYPRCWYYTSKSDVDHRNLDCDGVDDCDGCLGDRMRVGVRGIQDVIFNKVDQGVQLAGAKW